MTKLLAVLTACLALSLTLAACGGDDDDGGSGDSAAPSQPAETTAGDKPAAGGETVTVDMRDIKYVPQDVTVKTGTTVTWTNSDKVPHTVTKDAGPGEQFDSGTIAPGGEYEQTFAKAGKVDYVCTIHPNQVGSVTVE
jgi:plastocyanin